MKHLEENKVYTAPFAIFGYGRNYLVLYNKLVRASDNFSSIKNVKYYLKKGVLYISGDEIHWDFDYYYDIWISEGQYELIYKKYEDFHFKKMTRTKRFWLFWKRESEQLFMKPWGRTSGWFQLKKTTPFELKTSSWTVEQC